MGEGAFILIQAEGALYCRGETIVLIGGLHTKNVGKFPYNPILFYNSAVVPKDSLLFSLSFSLSLEIFIHELHS